MAIPDQIDQPDVSAPPVTARALTLSVATVATSLLVAGAAVLPMPYAVSSPGPTQDTLGQQGDTPLVTISGARTYEPTGRLLLTTVLTAGGPGYPVGLLSVVEGWLDPARSVRPVETIFAPSETREQVTERNQASMASSQENATVAALEELGYEVPTTLLVVETVEGTGAHGVVEPDDVVLAVDGQEVGSFSQLSARMDRVEPGSVVTLTVERGGEPADLDVTTQESDGKAILGVLIDPAFDLPVEVSIEIDDVGGPSAGTMFALAIIDLMTEVDETGGETVAGTGTMDLAGQVGPISGIRQKLAGAREDGATWFLAPESNCDEVLGHVPAGLQVAAVSTLHEAREAVEAIGAGRGDRLPDCT